MCVSAVICLLACLLACLFSCLLAILFVRRPWSGNGGGIGFPTKVIEGFPYAPGHQKHGDLDLLLGFFSFDSLSLLACVLPTGCRKRGKCCLYEHASITYVHKPCGHRGHPARYHNQSTLVTARALVNDSLGVSSHAHCQLQEEQDGAGWQSLLPLER